jgi:3-oxoadipate enol-lactonase
MPFAPVEDGQLFYRVDGKPDLPVLVLSNSLGTDHTMWDAQVGAFTGKFRLVRYDSRGHGASTVISGDYTMNMLGKDVLSLLDHLGLKTARFCGLSIGGMVGQWLGLNAPDRVKKIVLCNTAAKIGNEETWNARIETVRKNGMRSISEATLQRWFTPAFQQREPATVARIPKILEATPAEGYASTCAAIRGADFRPDVRRIRTRTLIVAGTHDPATMPADGQWLAQQIPGAQYKEFNTAHLSNVEAPQAFSDAVLKFLVSC